MKYNKKELLKEAKKATAVETYEYTDRQNHHIHTDCVKYIGNGNFDKSEIEGLPYDKQGEVDVDIEFMDREDYDSTLCANCDMSWDDSYAEDDIVLVIVVR